MAKKKGIKTPEWITQGYNSEEEYKKAKGISSSGSGNKKKGKTFKIKECPECESDNVAVVVGQDKKDEWKCNDCGWQGKEITEKELSEEEFLKYLDEKGEPIA